MDRRRRGRNAERAAERLLRRQGLVILARNWRGGGGEIDLAALDRETIVFVEVKSRAAGFEAEYAPVTAAQQRRIARAARAFRSRYGVGHLPVRYDLVTLGDEPERMTWDKSYWRTME